MSERTPEQGRGYIEFVGGPLDGRLAPDDGTYFKEGDTVAVDTLSLLDPEKGWSAESVYRVRGGRLVYDQEATNRRAEIARRYGKGA